MVPRDPAEPGGDDPERAAEPTGPERWIRPFFEDSTLWPVLIVAVGTAVTLGAAMVLMALRGNPFAVAALLALALMSADIVYRDVRAGVGLATRAVVILWLLVAISAAIAGWFGIL